MNKLSSNVISKDPKGLTIFNQIVFTEIKDESRNKHWRKHHTNRSFNVYHGNELVGTIENVYFIKRAGLIHHVGDFFITENTKLEDMTLININPVNDDVSNKIKHYEMTKVKTKAFNKSTRFLNMIYASTKDNLIGVNYSLPWKSPKDMEFFKSTTKGKIVVMGKKTWESLPFISGLPDRLNIVISSTLELPPEIADRAKVYPSVKAFIEEYLNKHLYGGLEKEVYVIGGGEIYKQLEQFSKTIYHTLIDDNIVDNEIINKTPVELKTYYRIQNPEVFTDLAVVYKDENITINRYSIKDN